MDYFFRPVGTIIENTSNLLLIKKHDEDPFRNLLKTQMEDIELLIHQGTPILGDVKFLNFSDVLKNIRDEFLSDSDWLEHDIVAKTNGRTPKKWIRHFSVEEVLKLYEYIDITKTNAVLIPNDIHIDSHGLIDDDGNFTTISIKSLDGCKRMVPLLIKNIDCSFSEISEYLSSGEGQDFILELNCDRDKLRKSICSFKEFKERLVWNWYSQWSIITITF